MREEPVTPGDAAELRRRAEARARNAADAAAGQVPADAEGGGRVIHELRVHQIELAMQNEELRRAQAELEVVRARYFTLYDLAPVSYCTLSEQGLILEANLTAATQLGVPRGMLGKQLLSRFVSRESQDAYTLQRRRLVDTRKPQTCELQMQRGDGSTFWAHLTATVAEEPGSEPVHRVVISDISERKFREEEREQMARMIATLNAPGDFRSRIAELTAALRVWSGCEAVGIRLRDGDDYPYYETRGFPAEFVRKESRLCVDGPGGKPLCDADGQPVLACMCGNILCGRFDPSQPFFTGHGSFWTNSTTALLASTTAADRQARTRNWCHMVGYESVALIPMRDDKQVFGLLQFNDHQKNRFTPDLIRCFERMADSLALALARRQAQEALRESEEKFRALANLAPIGIYLTDARGQCQYVNPCWCTAAGLSVEEALGGGWLRGVHPEDRDAVMSNWQKMVESEGRWGLEYRFQAGGGKVTWVYGLAVPRRDAAGRVVGYVGTNMDITERKKAEEGLRVSTALLKDAQQVAGLGSYVLDIASGDWRSSDVLDTIFGIDAAYDRTVAGWAALVHPDDRQMMVDYFAREVVGRAGRFDKEYRIVRQSDKAERWVHGLGRLDLDASGHPVSMSGTIQDITERRQMEERLRQSEKMQAIGQLAGGVAHDFNNQLGGIMGFAELLAESVEDPVLKGYADGIVNSASRAATLTRQLLAFSRKGKYMNLATDVHKVIGEVVGLLSRGIDKRIQIRQRLDAASATVMADAGQLQNALLNLGLNARDAMPDGGTLLIATSVAVIAEAVCEEDLAPGRYLQVSVTDTGVGMDAATRKRLFEPFFTTKEVGKGTGLGLASVYGTVKNHGGTIRVSSEPGRGSTFSILLPLIAESDAGGAAAETPALAAAGGHGRILIVDDEAAILDVGSAMLRKQGYAVTTCMDPGEALEVYRREWRSIDLVVLDMVMPGMGGKELFQAMKAENPAIKAVLSSGYSMSGETRDIMNLGVRAFVQKPFRRTELVQAVGEALRKDPK